MKPWIIAFIFLIILAGVALASQRRSSSSVLANASAKPDSSLVIYDVRTADEYTAGHVEGANLLPLQDIQKGIRPSEPTDASIGIYCRSGSRAKEAISLLQKAGYTNLTDLGGLGDVQRAGYKIIR